MNHLPSNVFNGQRNSGFWMSLQWRGNVQARKFHFRIKGRTEPIGKSDISHTPKHKINPFEHYVPGISLSILQLLTHLNPEGYYYDYCLHATAEETEAEKLTCLR